MLVEQELVEILKAAIRQEMAAQKRYRRGMELSDKPEIREMFEELLHEETRHEQVLREKLLSVKKKLGLKVVKTTEAGAKELQKND